MTRADLLKHLINRCPHLTSQEAKMVVTSFCQQIIQAVAQGDHVTLRGFGRFSAKVLPPRQGHNPKTGERLDLPMKRDLKFRAALLLNRALNPSRKPKKEKTR